MTANAKAVQIAGKIYRADGKYLVCKDAVTGEQCFRKAFNNPEYRTLRNLDICEVYPSPDGRNVVLLLEPAPAGYKTVGNLVCVTLTGEVTWWAELTDTGKDTYVSVGISEGRIVAQSWHCFSCEIDPQTGRVLSTTFTK